MKGILALVFVCLIADFTDAATVTGWTETDYTVSAGTGTAKVTMKLTAKVLETNTAAAAIMTLTAAPAGTYTYAFTSAGNPGSYGNIATPSATAGAITLATGKYLDYETTKSIVFVVTATPATGDAGTATVTVEIKNKIEFKQTHFILCVADGLAAGSTIGTYTVTDKASDDTLAYSLTSTVFDYGATTGVVTVKTGQTLNMYTVGGHALDLTATASAGSSDTTAVVAKLWITVGTCSSALQVTAMLGMLMLSFATSLFL